MNPANVVERRLEHIEISAENLTSMRLKQVASERPIGYEN
jgi:hypothetical protein